MHKFIAIVIVCCAFIMMASAEETPNGSYVTIDYQPLPTVTNNSSSLQIDSHYLQQGDTVYLNECYDISGALQGYEDIAYWDGYDMYNSIPSYNLSLPNKKSGYYDYCITPEIFGNRLGKWFKYNGYFEKAGNNLAFIVKEERPTTPLTLPNGTVLNQTIKENASIIPRPYVLKEKAVSDYLVARGDILTIETGGPAKVWIGGRVDGLYDYYATYSNISFDGELTQSLEPGSYRILIVKAGNNTEFDERFYNRTGSIYENKNGYFVQYKAGWDGVKEIKIDSYTPSLILDQIQNIIVENTDDTFEVKKLEVEDPAVTIDGFTEVPMSTEYTGYQYYKTQPGFVSLFDVRGYTNTNPGTNITVVLDDQRRNPKDRRLYTFHTTAQRQFYGNMSYYQVYVPIVWDEMTIGMHNLTTTTEKGGKMEYTFPISILPADSYKPNATVKYALNSSPWVPTPTPVVIKENVVVTVVQTRVVIEKVTPTQDEIKSAQTEIIKEGVIKYGSYSILGIAVIVVGYFVVRFIYRARKRQMWEKK